jgi:hypothetical protein
MKTKKKKKLGKITSWPFDYPSAQCAAVIKFYASINLDALYLVKFCQKYTSFPINATNLFRT